MIIKINKTTIFSGNLTAQLSILILGMMVFQIVLGRWLFLSSQIGIILILLFFFHLVSSSKEYLKLGTVWFYSIAILLYFYFSLWQLDGKQEVWRNNLKVIAPSICMVVFTGYLIVYRMSFLERFLDYLTPVLNICYILNIPMLLLQLQGHIELAGRHPENVYNPMFEDMISGLMGYNGTHVLGMFMSLMLVLNIRWGRKIELPFNRIVFKIYNAAISLFMLWISTKNDNKSVILIIAIFLGVYYIFRMRINEYSKGYARIEKVLKRVFIITIAAIVAFYALLSIPAFNHMIVNIFDRIVKGLELGVNATGSAERIGIVVHMLFSSDHKWLGYGLGNAYWAQPNFLGMPHFGQSDMGSFLALGGIVFAGLLFALIFFCGRLSKRNNIEAAAITCFYLILLLYTQVFTEPSTMYITLLFMITCYVENSGSQKCQ